MDYDTQVAIVLAAANVSNSLGANGTDISDAIAEAFEKFAAEIAKSGGEDERKPA